METMQLAPQYRNLKPGDVYEVAGREYVAGEFPLGELCLALAETVSFDAGVVLWTMLCEDDPRAVSSFVAGCIENEIDVPERYQPKTRA